VIHDEQMHGAHDEATMFVSLAEELIGEHARLTELAERCRVDGEAIAARESAIVDRERSFDSRRRELAEEAERLARWRDELNEKMHVVEAAEQRIAEARERELRLAALGNELLAQYGSTIDKGD
jgi:chromosome segregation ATPase